MEYFEIEKDMEEFLNNKIAVNCRTEKDAREFLDFLASEHRVKWCNNDELNKSNTYWDHHKDKTCYTCHKSRLTYCYIAYYERLDYEILTYQDIESESSIESGLRQNLNIKSSNKRRIFIIEE